MAFNKRYKSLAEVLQAFGLKYVEFPFVVQNLHPFPKSLKEDLDFTLSRLDYKSSESAIREYVISPILKAAWKPFADALLLWVEKPIYYDEILNGVPDYIISQRSKMGKIFFEKPYIAVLEAKKDDFTAGWAQCCLEMIALQKINQHPQRAVYGIVSNGDVWEFAKLHEDTFTQFKGSIGLTHLETLFDMLCTLFADGVSAN